MSWITDRPRSAVAAVGLVALLTAVDSVSALLFEPRQLDDGRRVLLVRDCGVLEDRASCEPWTRSFHVAGRYPRLGGGVAEYSGDAAVLETTLMNARRAGSPYDEVWLVSGGGHLQAGVEVGRVLRRHGMTVRVPRGARCVSACTVAFMGGLFRFVDEGATYQVHAASTVLGDLSPGLREAVEEGDFAAITQYYRRGARRTARQLLTHFQNTLILPLGVPPVPENDREFEAWARNSPPRNFYPSDQAARDRERLAAEGFAAAQDILMRIERAAMDAAIEDLREMIRLGGLGPRAEPALRMVEAMYDVSIVETAVLTRETMLRMGYITQEVPGGGNE